MGVIISHGACARMDEGNVTNNLNYLFPDLKGGGKIDYEAPPQDLFLLRTLSIQRRIFKPCKHLTESFLQN